MLKDCAAEAVHKCYLAAFKAIGSNKFESWTIEDTLRYQSLCPEVIWTDEALWGVYGKQAREAFYSLWEDIPIQEVRREAFQMMLRLDRKNCKSFIFSMKTKNLMLQEVCRAGLASYATGFYGTDPGVVLTREEMLKQIVDRVGGDAEISVVASENYRKAAEKLNCEFILAQEDVFYNID